MMMILGQAAADPAIIGIWLGCGVAVIAGVNQALKFADRFRPNPPTHEKYATKTELIVVSEHVERLEAKIDGTYRELNKAGDARATKIHERINTLTEKVGELTGAVRARLK